MATRLPVPPSGSRCRYAPTHRALLSGSRGGCPCDAAPSLRSGRALQRRSSPGHVPRLATHPRRRVYARTHADVNFVCHRSRGPRALQTPRQATFRPLPSLQRHPSAPLRPLPTTGSASSSTCRELPAQRRSAWRRGARARPRRGVRPTRSRASCGAQRRAASPSGRRHHLGWGPASCRCARARRWPLGMSAPRPTDHRLAAPLLQMLAVSHPSSRRPSLHRPARPADRARCWRPCARRRRTNRARVQYWSTSTRWRRARVPARAPLACAPPPAAARMMRGCAHGCLARTLPRPARIRSIKAPARRRCARHALGSPASPARPRPRAHWPRRPPAWRKSSARSCRHRGRSGRARGWKDGAWAHQAPKPRRVETLPRRSKRPHA